MRATGEELSRDARGAGGQVGQPDLQLAAVLQITLFLDLQVAHLHHQDHANLGRRVPRAAVRVVRHHHRPLEHPGQKDHVVDDLVLDLLEQTLEDGVQALPRGARRAAQSAAGVQRKP